MDWKFKIIKLSAYNKMLEKLDKFHASWQEVMREFENLHRLHDALWDRYKNELQARDVRIADLEAQLRKAEHQRNEYKKKVERLSGKEVKR